MKLHFVCGEVAKKFLGAFVAPCPTPFQGFPAQESGALLEGGLSVP